MVAVTGVWAIMYLPGSKNSKVEVIKPEKHTPRISKKLLSDTQEQKGSEASEEIDLEVLMEKIRLRSQKIIPISIRDPFKKLDLKDVVLDFSDLTLVGIMTEKEEQRALINDQILKVGDTISGFNIIEIKENSVVLSKGLERYVLNLSRGEREE